MKKIGILTFHRAYNYGAYMQCYSLCKKTQELFPDDIVEVIDYSSQKMIRFYDTSIKKDGSIISLNNNVKDILKSYKQIGKKIVYLTKYKKRRFEALRNKEFDSAIKSLPLSNDSLISDDLEQATSFLSEKYDVIIVGSDAIWNDIQTSFPNIYYLCGVDTKEKFSYAASSHGMDYTKKTEQEIKYLREAMNDFFFIGVRDAATMSFLDTLNLDAKVSHTCDPTIFLDMEQLPVDLDMLRIKLIESGVDFGRPIIGLMCDEWLAKDIKKYFSKEFQLVSVYTYNPYADVCLPNLSPFEWSKVFSFFDVTITHFFHGTLLSLKNNTLTIPIERETPYSRKFDTKIKDVMTRLGLLDYYFTYNQLNATNWEEVLYSIKSNKKTRFSDKIENAIRSESKTADIFFDKLKDVL